MFSIESISKSFKRIAKKRFNKMYYPTMRREIKKKELEIGLFAL